MPRKAQKIQELYDVGIEDWEKSLASISRKLTRVLVREGIKYSLKYRVKTVESLQPGSRWQRAVA